jgi:hypothetical protein
MQCHRPAVQYSLNAFQQQEASPVAHTAVDNHMRSRDISEDVAKTPWQSSAPLSRRRACHRSHYIGNAAALVDGPEVRQLAARVDLDVAAGVKEREGARVGWGTAAGTGWPCRHSIITIQGLRQEATSYGCQAVLH